MGTLPTDRDTADIAADHVTDHNTLHTLNNQLGNFTQATAAPGSPVAGDLWLDTDESAGVGLSSIIAYADGPTADQTGISTVTDITGMTVTVTVPAGRRIRLRVQGDVISTVANDVPAVRLKEGATALARYVVSLNAAATSQTISCDAVLTPSAGSHTYKVTLERAIGTGTLTWVGTNTQAAYILVEDITGTLWPAGQSIGAGTIASEAWTDWTPTLTNMTLGNGLVVATYQRIGRTIHYRFKFTLGSTSAMGTQPTFTLPVPYNTIYFEEDDPIGRVMMGDQGTAVYSGECWPLGGSTVRLLIYNSSATYLGYTHISATVPFTWTSTDCISAHGTYEAAS